MTSCRNVGKFCFLKLLIRSILVHSHYLIYFPDGYGYPYRAQDVLECEFILLEAMVRRLFWLICDIKKMGVMSFYCRK